MHVMKVLHICTIINYMWALTIIAVKLANVSRVATASVTISTF